MQGTSLLRSHFAKPNCLGRLGFDSRQTLQDRFAKSGAFDLVILIGCHFLRIKSEINTVSACRVPAYYALILRSLTVLEGLALTADRHYKLLGRAYPYMARRLLTDPAPQLRSA